MQIASVLAGFSLGEADILLNAMRKKVEDVMAEQRGNFVKGSVAAGVSEKTAGDVFELMDKFAGYGFNKAHSASYAVLAVRTGYLKPHYPSEFMAATLTSEMDNSDLDHVIRQSGYPDLITVNGIAYLAYRRKFILYFYTQRQF